MPSPTVLTLSSTMVGGSETSPKSRLPVPSTIGKIMSRTSSTNPVLQRATAPASRCPRPADRPAAALFSAVTSRITSPLITVELFQVASSSCKVVDTTYLGMAFIRSAKPTESCMVGHAWAKA